MRSRSACQIAAHPKSDRRRDDLCEKPTKRKPNRCTSYEVQAAIRRTASSQSLSAALHEKDRPADSQSPGPQESSEADYVIVASNTGFKLAVSQLHVDSPQLRRVAQSAPREVLGNHRRQSRQSRLELGLRISDRFSRANDLDCRRTSGRRK